MKISQYKVVSVGILDYSYLILSNRIIRLKINVKKLATITGKDWI